MREGIKSVLAIAAPLVVGGLSGAATSSGVASWYPTLVKQSFNPPAWIFGPVWTTLYLLMGVAAFIVWRQAAMLFYGSRSRSRPTSIKN